MTVTLGVLTATGTRQDLGVRVKWQESEVDSVPSLPPRSLRCSTGESLCLCHPDLCGCHCHELQSGHFGTVLDQATAEAELGQGLQPIDPQLPVSVQEGHGQGQEKIKAQTLGLKGGRECPERASWKKRLGGIRKVRSPGGGRQHGQMFGVLDRARIPRIVWESTGPEGWRALTPHLPPGSPLASSSPLYTSPRDLPQLAPALASETVQPSMCPLPCQASPFSCQLPKVRSLRNRVGSQITRVLVGMGPKPWGYESLGSWESGTYVLRVPGSAVVWAWAWESYNQTSEEPLPLHQGASSALWTGLDFAHVADGAGLSLLVPTVPYALEYDIVLSCETQVSGMGDRQVNGWCWLRGRGSSMTADPLP